MLGECPGPTTLGLLSWKSHPQHVGLLARARPRSPQEQGHRRPDNELTRSSWEVLGEVDRLCEYSAQASTSCTCDFKLLLPAVTQACSELVHPPSPQSFPSPLYPSAPPLCVALIFSSTK